MSDDQLLTALLRDPAQTARVLEGMRLAGPWHQPGTNRRMVRMKAGFGYAERPIAEVWAASDGWRGVVSLEDGNQIRVSGYSAEAAMSEVDRVLVANRWSAA